MQVLIHSPDSQRLAALGRVLQGAGWTVVGVTDSQELARVTREHQVPLLVVDAGPQDPGGLQFFTAWQRAEAPHVPVLLMVERLEPAGLGPLFTYGVVDVLEQPLTMALLHERAHAAAAFAGRTLRAWGEVEPRTVELLVAYLQRTGKTGNVVVDLPQGSLTLGVYEGRFADPSLLQYVAGAAWLQNLQVEMPQVYVNVPVDPVVDVVAPFQPVPTPQGLTVQDVLPVPATPLPALPPVRALVVDDDEALVEICGRFLERVGFVVERCSSGAAAHAAALRFRPNVIVSDIMMPEVDGWALLRLIRGDQRLRELPFLLLSCHDEYRDRLAQVGAGADAYLAKGIKGEQLTAAVVREVQRHREVWSAAAPHTRIEGSLDRVGALNLANALAHAGVRGVLRARDQFNDVALGFSSGMLTDAQATNEVLPTSGPDAVRAYISLRNASFAFDPREAPAGQTSVRVQDVLEQACLAVNAADEAVTEQLLLGSTGLMVRPDMIQLYERVCAHVSPRILEALTQGMGAAETMMTTGESPILVEWVIKDMVRKGVASFRLGNG